MSRGVYLAAMTTSRTSCQSLAICTSPLRRAQRSSMLNWFNKKKQMKTDAVEISVLGGPFLIATGRADRNVHADYDILQAIAVMKAVDP